MGYGSGAYHDCFLGDQLSNIMVTVAMVMTGRCYFWKTYVAVLKAAHSISSTLSLPETWKDLTSQPLRVGCCHVAGSGLSISMWCEPFGVLVSLIRVQIHPVASV